MRSSLFVPFALAACLVSPPAWGASIIVGHLENSTPNAFPFGGRVGANAGTRYQQAYAASDFDHLGLISISDLHFFLTFPGTLGTSTYSLYFSTITAGIDTLSNVDFNSNRGPDNSLFASVTLSGDAPAELRFTGHPFTYDPAAGNLLLDIVVSPGGQRADIMAGFAANLNATGVFSRYHNFGAGNVSFGLVTQFDYAAVPEPSVLALIGLGLAAIGRSHRGHCFGSGKT